MFSQFLRGSQTSEEVVMFSENYTAVARQVVHVFFDVYAAVGRQKGYCILNVYAAFGNCGHDFPIFDAAVRRQETFYAALAKTHLYRMSSSLHECDLDRKM